SSYSKCEPVTMVSFVIAESRMGTHVCSVHSAVRGDASLPVRGALLLPTSRTVARDAKDAVKGGMSAWMVGVAAETVAPASPLLRRLAVEGDVWTLRATSSTAEPVASPAAIGMATASMTLRRGMTSRALAEPAHTNARPGSSG